MSTYRYISTYEKRNNPPGRKRKERSAEDIEKILTFRFRDGVSIKNIAKIMHVGHRYLYEVSNNITTILYINQTPKTKTLFKKKAIPLHYKTESK